MDCSVTCLQDLRRINRSYEKPSKA